MILDGLSLTILEREHATKVLRGVEGIDKVIREVVETTGENRRKIRRRVED